MEVVMESILGELNQAVGILGSMIFTKDGVYVIGKSAQKIDQDTAAAIASNIVRGCGAALERLGKDDFQQFIVESTKGKIVIFDAGPAYLFVIADHNIHLNVTILDIRSAANKITKELN